MLKVFAGYDPRIPAGFEVFRASVERHAKDPVEVIPLDQDKLRSAGWYWREEDRKASTPFSLTRFLTPTLAEFKGRSIFVDGSDMIVTRDIAELADAVDDSAPVWCVQHKYRPKTGVKFLNQMQYAYPRKNWSSVMVFNNWACKGLSRDAVNSETPAYLHRMGWSETVGELGLEWNWLAGEPEYQWPVPGVTYDPSQHNPPALIHYTLGLPIVPGATKTEFDYLWYSERQRMVDRVLCDPSLDFIKDDEPAASSG